MLLLVRPQHPFLSNSRAGAKARLLGTGKRPLQVQESPVDGKARLNEASNSGLVLPSDSSQLLEYLLIDNAGCAFWALIARKSTCLLP